MLRTALKPRWLALLVVVVVAATFAARLGDWQLSRAREQGQEEAARQVAQPPVPLTSLLRARQSFPREAGDRRVTATGRWDGARQVLVAGRLLAGTEGLWVLTPLRLPDGSAVPVVRGWVASAGDPGAGPAGLPAGDVAVEGVLRPAEAASERPPGEGNGLPEGQLDRVAGTELVQLWPYPLLTGYVVLTGQTPAPSAAAAAPRPVSADPPRGGGLDLRNLSYALQWWVFAAFGLFLWWRIVRDDHLGRLRPAQGAAPDGDGPDGDGPDGDGPDGDGPDGDDRVPGGRPLQPAGATAAGPAARPAADPTDDRGVPT